MACPHTAYSIPSFDPISDGPYCIDCGIGNAEERCKICGDTMCWACHITVPRCDDCIEKQNEYEDRKTEQQAELDNILYDEIHNGD